MTLALAVSSHVPPQEDSTGSEDIRASQNRALLAFELESVTSLDEEQTVVLQGILRHGTTLGTWHSPPEWLPSGAPRARPDVNIRRRIVAFIPQALRTELEGRSSALLSRAVLVATHYTILLRMGPSGTGRAMGRPLGANQIFGIVNSYLPQLLAVALRVLADRSKRESGSWSGLARYHGPLLEAVNLDDLDTLSANAKQHVLKECHRMHILSAQGLWQDLPALEGETRSTVLAGPARYNPPEGAKNPHLPLPDDYVSLLGQRCLWLITQLAPNLFVLGSQLERAWHATLGKGWVPNTVRERRRQAVRDIFSRHVWRDRSGAALGDPPFPLALSKPKGFKSKLADDITDEIRWPPKTHIDFMSLVGTVQAAHMCIALLSTGGRQSEVLDLQRNCVERAVDGRQYANGKTFKLVRKLGGEARDWQLPELAVLALEQQSRLVALGERVGLLAPDDSARPGDTQLSHLWAQLSAAPGASSPWLPVTDINRVLVSFARRIGLEAQPGGQRLRSHRFRKTLARLVALALTQAPRILMDVFGHKSMEMTLYYILSDKDLRVEIEAVSRELRVMRAKDVVDKMVDADLRASQVDDAALGGYGGLAAVSVRKSIDVHRQRVHRRGNDWGTNSAYELADLLTLQGRAWDQVREGVICTKFVGEAGPCNKSKGRPEPSKCQSSCSHRLEEAFLHNDVDDAIKECVSAYERATLDDESLTAAHWAAQIRTHLGRFDDLRERWMKNPTARSVWGQDAEVETA